MKLQRIVLRGFLIAVAVAVLAGSWWVVRAERGLAKAEQLVELGLWSGVRLQARRYLALHPNDAKARLLIAEAWVRDDSLDSQEAARKALAELQYIPDDSPLAAEARTEAGRREFLILCRPERAERLFRKAIELDPSRQDARHLLWKVFDQTERSHLAAPIFWPLYELTPADGQSVLLREWYMSQLFPTTANADLDRLMGFIEPNENASTASEGKRLAHFKNSDPTSPLVYASLARWFHKQGDVHYASKILEEGLVNVQDQPSHPFFVAMLVRVLLDLGEFERAKAVFSDWPAPREGFEYLRWRAVLLDEVDRDYERAIEDYEAAIALWPGPFEWRLHNRLANCLTRVGRKSEAEAVRKRAAQIAKMMDDAVHTRLREVLQNLDDPTQLRELSGFYRDLNCNREVQAWDKVLRRLGADRQGEETATK